MTERRVVVTGIGTINPLGNNIEEYFSNLEKGVSGAAPITHFDAEKFKTINHLPDEYLCTRFFLFDLGSYLLM